jgi:hypothetical protein
MAITSALPTSRLASPWTAVQPAPVLRPPSVTSTPYPGTAVNNPLVIPFNTGAGSGVTPTPISRVPTTTQPVLRSSMPAGFTDLRTQTIGAPAVGGAVAAPKLGGSISAPAAGPAIAPQNAQPTLQALQAALAGMTSPEAQRLRQMSMSSLEGLSSAPNRAELAAQALQLQRDRTQDDWMKDLRGVGALNAAMGRMGSGMVTTGLMDVTAAREKALAEYGRDAALQAAGAEMGDRLGIFDRTAGLGSQYSAEDLARAGFRRDIANNVFDVEGAVRGQRVGERDYSTDQAWRRTGLAVDQQGRADQNAWRGTDLSLNNRNFGADQAWRGIELRTQQQGRQDQQGQAAIDNAARERMLQEQLLDAEFRRRLAAGGAAGSIGYSNDPYGTMTSAGQTYAGQAGASTTALQQAAQAAALQRMLAGV